MKHLAFFLLHQPVTRNHPAPRSQRRLLEEELLQKQTGDLEVERFGHGHTQLSDALWLCTRPAPDTPLPSHNTLLLGPPDLRTWCV